MRRLVGRPPLWVFFVAVGFGVNFWTAWMALQVPSHQFARPSMESFDWASSRRAESKTYFLLPEELTWYRILRESPLVSRGNGSRRCNSTAIPTVTKSQAIQSGNVTLPRLGFQVDVLQHLQSQRVMSEGNASLLPLPQDMECPLLSSNSTMCHVNKYSVIVTSTGENLRLLFLNLMSFLAYPSTLDMTVILPVGKHELTKDADYGHRLMKWHSRQTSRVTLIFNPSLWSALEQEQLQPKSEAIIWINGDVLYKDWTKNSLKATLEMWKKLPSSTIMIDTGTISASRSFSSLLETCSWLKGITIDSPLHGIMVHRNALCYLQHPLTMSLRRFGEVLDWDATRVAVTLYLVRIIRPGPLQQLEGFPTISLRTPLKVHQRLHRATQQQLRAPRNDATLFTSLVEVINYFGCCSFRNTLHLATSVVC